ncbi:MAG: hypothetical protein QY325_12465 [Flavobacteriales bacterium]|nr:MAG: hypothetical protein QY325_12465 [Flavobacteriales bacterium]
MRKRVVLLQLAAAYSLLAAAQAPVWCWATGLSGNGTVSTELIAANSTNGSFVTGMFDDTLALPGGTLVNDGTLGNRFIARLDSLGNVLWAVQHDDPVVAMSATATGGVVGVIPYSGSSVFNGVEHLGSATATSALIVELDADGAVLSETNISDLIEPAVPESGRKLALDADAGLAVLAQYADSVAIVGQWVQTDGTVLARLSLQGNLLWAERIGKGSVQTGALELDPSGRVLVLMNNCEQVLATDSVFTDMEGTLASYSAQGLYEWRVQGLGYDVFEPCVVERRPDGGAFVGVSQPSQGPIGIGTELTLRSFSASGTEEWASYAYGSSQWGHAIHSIEYLPSNRALVAGYALSTLPQGVLSMTLPSQPNGFAGIVSSSGAWEWFASETAGYIMGFRAVHGSASRVFVTGSAISASTFGSTVIPMVDGNFNGVVGCLGDIAMRGAERNDEPRSGLWPNPAEDHIQSQARPGESFSIVDAFGRVVGAGLATSSMLRLPVGFLPAGHYVLRVGDRAARFIKE